MTTSGNAPRADVARNREIVLAAALEVLSRDADASMREVADASGLGRTTVYRHFPNRDALTRALFEQVFAESVEAIGGILGDADDPHVVLPRIAQATLEIADQYRFLATHQVIAAEVMRQPREDPLMAWVESGIAAGTLRPLGATWVHGMIVALTMAATEEIREDRETSAEAARKLGDTLVAAFAI